MPRKRRARKGAASSRSDSVKRRTPSRVPPVNRYFTVFRRDANLSDAENKLLAEQSRQTALEKVRDDLSLVRDFFKGFEAKDGYSLKTADLMRIHPARLKKLRRYAKQIRNATSSPFVTFSPKNRREELSAVQRAGRLGKGQKKFIIHHGSSDKARVTVKYKPDLKKQGKYGTLEVKTEVEGGFIYDRIYYFYRRPRTWEDLVEQTKELMRLGMPFGNYKLYSALYGPIGSLTPREKLIEELQEYYSQYNTFLRDSLLGWVWLGSSLDSAIARSKKVETTAERFRKLRADRRKREEKLRKERLGGKSTKK